LFATTGIRINELLPLKVINQTLMKKVGSPSTDLDIDLLIILSNQRGEKLVKDRQKIPIYFLNEKIDSYVLLTESNHYKVLETIAKAVNLVRTGFLKKFLVKPILLVLSFRIGYIHTQL
jgi:hypothetical protein